MLVSHGQLYIASRSGVLARVHLCSGCLTNRSLAVVAKARLERAKALGLS
jgi:hypothetical protein